MKDFNEIVERIEAELSELKEINRLLKKENDMLKEKLEIKSIENDIAIKDLLKKIEFIGDDRIITRAINCLVRSERKYISDLGKKVMVDDLLNIKKAGSSVIAVIILVAEHYGIEVCYPRKNNSTIIAIKEYVNEYRDKIIFIE